MCLLFLGNVLCFLTLPNSLVASGSADLTIKIWKSPLLCVHTLKGHQNWIWSLVNISPSQFASASEDASIIIWSSDTFDKLHTLHYTSPLLCVNVMEDGTLLSGSSDSSIQVWSRDFKEYQIIQGKCNDCM